MAKLNFMHTIDDLMKYRATVWEMEVGEGRVPGIDTYMKYPCLVRAMPIRYAFNPEALGILTVACSRNEAKRIIYPKTNRNRCKLGGFTIIEGDNLMNAMSAYITRILEYAKATAATQNVDPAHPEQSRMIDRAMSDFDGVKGLALVYYRIYINLDRFRLVNFYTVDEADARKLVYYGKKPKRDIGFEEFMHEYKKHSYRTE